MARFDQYIASIVEQTLKREVFASFNNYQAKAKRRTVKIVMLDEEPWTEEELDVVETKIYELFGNEFIQIRNMTGVDYGRHADVEQKRKINKVVIAFKDSIPNDRRIKWPTTK